MEITWLGQAGLLFDNGKIKIMVDPYLSNSVEKVNPKNFRRFPVDESFFEVSPDIIIFTHDHLDHYDPETAEKFLTNSRTKITVLCPSSVFMKVRDWGQGHNYVIFDRYTEWTEFGFRFYAVKAVHSDPHAIGVIIEDINEKRKYYIAGDTLYNTEIFNEIPQDIYTLFLPVNGVGNNMNVTDAKRFSERIGAEKIVPIHVGMFDELTPAIFKGENRVIPEIYKKINS